jgi:hypothetical protein
LKDQVLIAAGLTALVFVSWRLVVALSNKPAQKGAFVLSPDVLLKPKPFFNEAELLLYNLIRLAVQDQYLVFARVPLWCVLQVEAEGQTRLNLLRHLALKCADLVLVHPGSREVEQIVQLEGVHQEEPGDKARRREIQVAMQAAGVRVTTLNVKSRYTVDQLAQLLGVSVSE